MKDSTGDEGRFTLPRFIPEEPGLRPGVDLFDDEQVAELVGDDETFRRSFLTLKPRPLTLCRKLADAEQGLCDTN